MNGRLFERIERIYAIGGGPGANRAGYTEGEQRAHDLAAGWFEEAGLAIEIDPDGNLIGRLAGDERAAEIWTGSHLDSVPNGGRFDGVLGVLAGLEAVERIGVRAARSQSSRSGTRSEASAAASDACVAGRCRRPTSRPTRARPGAAARRSAARRSSPASPGSRAARSS